MSTKHLAERPAARNSWGRVGMAVGVALTCGGFASAPDAPLQNSRVAPSATLALNAGPGAVSSAAPADPLLSGPAITEASRPSRALPMGCVIEPAKSAEVSAPVGGVLEAVLVERGARVHKGQVIAILESKVEKAAWASARARAASQSGIAAHAAERDLARTKLERMYVFSKLDRGARLELETAAAEFEIADHRLQQAREALSVAQREEEMSRAQLDQRRIRSPIDGVVADRLLNPGERVDGRPIIRVLTPSQLRVEVVVPATRFGEIQEGSGATITPEILNAPAMPATVVQVDRFVDAASGTFRARLALQNPSENVPAGARCKVAFAPEGHASSAAQAALKDPRVRAEQGPSQTDRNGALSHLRGASAGMKGANDGTGRRFPPDRSARSVAAADLSAPSVPRDADFVPLGDSIDAAQSHLVNEIPVSSEGP